MVVVVYGYSAMIQRVQGQPGNKDNGDASDRSRGSSQ